MAKNTRDKVKIIAANILFENEEIPFIDKVRQLKVISELNEYELKSLILDGKIECLDEQAKQTLLDRFECKQIPEYLTESVILGIAVGSAIWFLWRTIQAVSDKSARICGSYSSSDDRNACMYKVRYLDSKRKIQLYKKMMEKEVPKRKNSEILRKRIENNIDSEYERMQKQEEKIESERNKFRSKIKKAQEKIEKFTKQIQDANEEYSFRSDIKNKIVQKLEDNIREEHIKITRWRNLIRQYSLR